MGGETSKPAEQVPRNGPNIKLNVYQAANQGQSTQTMQMPGFGIYHTGIEIMGKEYTFAGGDFAGCGVQEQVPKATPSGSQWVYNQTVELGKTNLSEAQVSSVLSAARADFPARSYDLTGKNCNHFTEVMSHRLNVHDKYPSWVNRAAKWGNSMKGGSTVDVVAMEEKKKKQQEMKRREEEKARALLAKKQESLKAEPPAEADGVVEIQLNLPNGAKKKRRFFNTDTIQDVMDYATAFDLSLKGKFHLRTNFPRKTFTNHRESLINAGFSRRENLFVERPPE